MASAGAQYRFFHFLDIHRPLFAADGGRRFKRHPKFDIHAEDVPVDIMDNLTNSAYHEYKIDEVTQIDKPSGTFYVFKLEHENNEVRLTFNSEAQLLK